MSRSCGSVNPASSSVGPGVKIIKTLPAVTDLIDGTNMEKADWSVAAHTACGRIRSPPVETVMNTRMVRVFLIK
jgi:hypothetical protein